MVKVEALECPKCHKNSLVRCEHSEHDLFQCINCGYRRDLTNESGSSQSEDPILFWVILVSAFFLVFAFLFP